MAYDEELAERIRAAVQGQDGVTEKRMFGGLAFLINGNMAVSTSGRDGLLLRVDPQETDSLVREDDVERFEMRGRRLNGWLHVGLTATASDQDLARWVDVGLAYAGSLPPK